MKKVERRRYYCPTMSIYNTLRSLPTGVADMMMKQGFVKDLSPEERERMDGCLNALVEEWFGASVKEEKPKKEKKTKAAVVTAPPGTMDRAYLETRTVSELKELGKDCAAIKGRKPRAELIELVLQHLSGSSPVAASGGEPAEESSDASDEELREEPPPASPASSASSASLVPTEDKAAKKEKKAKAEKPVKEKKSKPAKKEKKEVKAAETPAESDDENTVDLKEWFHPNEMNKPREERRRYFIDPKTNELFHPDRLEEGNAEWRWDEDSSEIVPI